MLERLAVRERISLRIDPHAEALSIVSGSTAPGWSAGSFLRPYMPRTRIILWGRSIEVQVTSRLAEAAGYDTITIDPSLSDFHAIDACDEDTAIVLLHHEVEREIPFLIAALKSRAFYIGALGSRRTHLRRSERLRSSGIGDDIFSRIRAPIGIFPRGRDASSIALSVLAEIAATIVAREDTANRERR